MSKQELYRCRGNAFDTAGYRIGPGTVFPATLAGSSQNTGRQELDDFDAAFGVLNVD